MLEVQHILCSSFASKDVFLLSQRLICVFREIENIFCHTDMISLGRVGHWFCEDQIKNASQRLEF